MEWESIIGSLIGSSPATALCALAVRALWKRLEERDAVISDLSQARVDDLREILERASSAHVSRPRD